MIVHPNRPAWDPSFDRERHARLAADAERWVDAQLALGARVADAQLALGARVADAQLALGAREVDAQLALGARVVDAPRLAAPVARVAEQTDRCPGHLAPPSASVPDVPGGDRTALSRVGAFTLDAVLVLLLVLALFLAYGKMNNRWYHLVTVEGGSMEPTYSVGDVLVLTRPPERLRVGDVVTMQIEGGIVTHRVVEVHPDGTFVTQGDANETVDDFDGLDVHVVGVVRGHLPWIGTVMPGPGSDAWLVDRAGSALTTAAATPPTDTSSNPP